MSTRTAAICLMLALASAVSGCATYKNASLCKQKMVSTYPDTSPELSYDFPKVSYGGTHVVVGATYETTNPTYKTDVVGHYLSPREVVDVKTKTSAAVECTFDGATMTTFRWLVPEKFAAVYKDVPDINGEVPPLEVQSTASPDEIGSGSSAASPASAAKP